MTYAQAFLSQELVEALGWTILHSLWQGALVAIALSVLMLFLNRRSAQVRYFISITALFTTLAIAVFTFWSIYQDPAKSTVAGPVPASTFSAENATVLPAAETSLIDKAQDFFVPYFEQHLPLLVTLWFMGLLVMALRMLGGLAYVNRLKHYQTQPLGAKWQNKLEELRSHLGVTKPVLLLESLQVKVPMAIGYLKPVILVPFGAVNGLTEKQVEAILAHELAHIFRHDYLFNLIQSFVETLFFYHPAIWWISAGVRAERENCCDDIAISLCGDTLTFAEALAELEELSSAYVPNLAMAFNGKKGSLLSRIKRLVNQPKRSASFTEGFLAACIVMVCVSVISLSAMAQLGPRSEELPIFLSKGLLLAKNETPAAEGTTAIEPANYLGAGSIECKPELADPKAGLMPAGFNLDDYTFCISKAPDPDGQDIIIIKDKKGRIAELYVDGKKVRKKDMPALEKIISERAGIPSKSKKKEYASKEDVAEAREALSNTRWRHASGSNAKVYVYEHPDAAPAPHPIPAPSSSYGYRYQYNAPTPPTPPAIDVDVNIPPMRPMKPMKPMKPMRPMKPLAPIADPEDSQKEYEAELKEYEQELKEYEKEMADYSNGNSEEWKEFEREMAEFGKEMAEYGKEMSEYMKNNVHVSVNDEKAAGIRDRNLERNIERSVGRSLEHSAEARARARARAAEGRAEAAKERARAAEIRARESEVRAKERAKAAAVRNERMDNLKAELRKDKIISENTTDFTYKINNGGLYVNDKKQSQELFEKYKKMFHPRITVESDHDEVYVIRDGGKNTITTINNSTGGNDKKDKAKSKDPKIRAKVKTEKKN